MRLFILLVLYCFSAIHPAGAQPKSKTMLAVFAHPDDENMIGAVLAKYARLGHKVYVIIATDGKDGTRVTSIPSGDSLGAIRLQETICACQQLGIQPRIYLHINRLDTRFGVRPYLDGRKKMMDTLKHLVQQLAPDVLLTFGPDGEYGHAEHIVTGAIVTELLLREGWVEKYPLYFPASTQASVAEGGHVNGFVHEQYLNVKIDFTNEDKLKMIEAAKCYVTQYTLAEMQELIEEVKKDTSNSIYFRRFYVAKETRKEWWD